MGISLNKRTIVILLVPIAIVTLLSFFFYQYNLKSIQFTNGIGKTIENQTAIRNIRSDFNVSDAQEDNFIKTGQEKYIGLANTARQKTLQDINDVQVLMLDNPDQQQRLNKLKEQIKIIVKKFEKIIKVKRLLGLEAAQTFDITDNLEFLNDNFQNEIIKMLAVETALLKARNLSQQEHLKRLHQLSFIGIILTFLFAIATSILLYQVAKNFAQIKRYNDELEKAKLLALSEAQDAKEAKLKAQEAEERFRMIVEGVKDYAIFLLDVKGNVLTWNLGAERIKGYKAEEIIGHHFSEFYPQEDINSGKPERELAIAEKIGIYQEEGLRIKKDGSPFSAKVLITALKDINGQLRGFSKIARDITLEKEHDEERRLLTIFQKAILDNAGSAVITGNLQGIITSFNFTAEKMLGYRADEMINKKSPSVFHDKDEVINRAKEFSLELNEPVKPGFDVFVVKTQKNMPNTHEWTYVRKDGRRFPVVLSVTALRDSSNNIFGYLGIATDISEQKQIQNELERSNKDLEQFAYIASHDLQEPLRMVVSFNQLLERKYKDKLDEQAQEYIHLAVDGATRMQGLINDLLMFSKTGTREVARTPIDLNIICQQVTKDLGALIDENKAIIEISTMPIIYANETQMHQLFLNLINNGIKYKSKRSPIIKVNSHQINDDQWQFSISDNGIGIEEKYFNKLFIIFQRLHTKAEYKGTGIGLALCKKIVENYGGHIWIESKIDEGTTFYFTLKIKTAT